MFTDKWAENIKHDRWYDDFSKNKVQLFTGGYNSDKLYFGYILAADDGFEFEDNLYSLAQIVGLRTHIDGELRKTELPLPEKMPELSIITFVEWD
ncbi:MAG: hypothetical protein IJO13_08885 [Lachnospiraceae bacterium]|nr:hypothetical protein [Lachnospiraceae bacterium]